MHLKRVLLVLVAGMIVVLGGCGGSKSSSGGGGGGGPVITAIALTPANSAITLGGSITFKAEASFSDGSQQDITSSASWSSSDSTVASVSAGKTNGQKVGVVTITVASGSISASTLLNVTDQNLGNGTAKGGYVFSLQGIDSVGPTYAAGFFSADGNGKISGVVDVNTAAKGVVAKSTLNGTYSVTPDGRGQMSISATGIGTNIPFRFIISKDGTRGKLIEFDGAAAVSGTFEQTTGAALSSGTPYTFRLGGVELDSTPQYMGEVGVLTPVTSTLTLSGHADGNLAKNGASGFNYANTSFNGTFGATDPTNNRGTMSLFLVNGVKVGFAYYVGTSKVFLVGTDSVTAGVPELLAGVAEVQTSSAALAGGNYTFLLDHAATTDSGDFEKTGQLTLSAGVVSAGSETDDFSNDTTMDQAFVVDGTTSTYSGVLNGRGTIDLTVQTSAAQTNRNFVFYTVDATPSSAPSSTRAYMMETACSTCSTSAFRAGIGEMVLGSLGGNLTLPVADDFIFSASEHGEANLLQVGQLVSDGSGNLSGIVDMVNHAGAGTGNFFISTVAMQSKLVKVSSSDPFEYTFNPPGVSVANYFSYVRPDGNQAVLLGFEPDIDGYIDIQ